MCGAMFGCGSDYHADRRAVVVIGDSLLYQSTSEVRSALNARGWQPVIQGVFGSTIAGPTVFAPSFGSWPRHLRALVEREHPIAVVIELGTNGCGRCTSLRSAVDALLHAADHVPHVYWIDVRASHAAPPARTNAALADAARRSKQLTIWHLADALKAGDIATDGIHLTLSGQRHFATLIAQRLGAP